MNFNQVQQATNGQSLAMFATVAEIGPSKLSSNQKPIQSVKLRDDAGEQHTVTLFKGNGELLTINNLNQRLSFNLSTYAGQRGLGYSGFWNNKANVAQPQQKAPQAPQQSTQQPNAQGKTNTDRQAAWLGACNYAGRMNLVQLELKILAREGLNFIENGEFLSSAPDPDPSIQGGNESPF